MKRINSLLYGFRLKSQQVLGDPLSYPIPLSFHRHTPIFRRVLRKLLVPVAMIAAITAFCFQASGQLIGGRSTGHYQRESTEGGGQLSKEMATRKCSPLAIWWNPLPVNSSNGHSGGESRQERDERLVTKKVLILDNSPLSSR